MATKNPNSIDVYISTFPAQTQVVLQQIRVAIQKAAPNAEETINYGIPTFKLNGNLVHFGGFKQHIGFYPAPSAIKAFANQLSIYKGAKGSVQFPINEPLPIKLITEIVRFRVKENQQKNKVVNQNRK